MPNTPVPAAGEAMPAAEESHIIGRFSRRALLGAIASIPAIGGATAALAVAAISQPADPLLDAIHAYRAGLADYNANAPDDNDLADAYVDLSYGPPLEVLDEWEEPATTRRGAIEALKLAIEENETFPLSSVGGPLLAAALAYFEAQS